MLLKRNKRKLDRGLLPDPLAYYAAEFPELKFSNREWLKVKCCFHNDADPSLSINMVAGCFRCFACGVKGGDVLSFHQQRYKLSFCEAVTVLGAWCHG